MSYKKRQMYCRRINRFDTELCGRRISLYSAEGNEPEGLGGKQPTEKKGDPGEKQGKYIADTGKECRFPICLRIIIFLRRVFRKIIARCREGSA